MGGCYRDTPATGDRRGPWMPSAGELAADALASHLLAGRRRGMMAATDASGLPGLVDEAAGWWPGMVPCRDDAPVYGRRASRHPRGRAATLAARGPLADLTGAPFSAEAPRATRRPAIASTSTGSAGLPGANATAPGRELDPWGGWGLVPRERSPSVTARSSAASDCEGWSDEGNFCAYVVDEGGGDSDLEEFDVKLLREAFELIDDNIQFVKNYYDRHAPDVSQTCHVTRLTGGDFWYPTPMVYETSTGGGSWAATNIYGSRYMLFNRRLFQGLKNEYQSTSKSDWRACLVIELARIIVHETAHSCWLGENFADLVDFYFCRAVAKDKGLVGTQFCCCNAPLEGGYDEEDYFAKAVSDDEAFYRLAMLDGAPPEAACTEGD